MSEIKKPLPYIFISKYTFSLYLFLLLITIYYSNQIYKYDQKMEEIKYIQKRYLLDKQNDLQFFKNLSDTDKFLLELYISNIIEKKKLENQKFNKIIGGFKNGCISGFLGSSLSGAPLTSSIITGITMGSTNALYKSITNYQTYQQLDI
jgi:hypothetical protein